METCFRAGVLLLGRAMISFQKCLMGCTFLACAIVVHVPAHCWTACSFEEALSKERLCLPFYIAMGIYRNEESLAHKDMARMAESRNLNSHGRGRSPEQTTIPI
jgi:hypothetical protein